MGETTLHRKVMTDLIEGLERRFHEAPEEPDGSLSSRTTGLRLEPEGLKLRLVDPATGERLLWSEERERALRG